MILTPAIADANHRSNRGAEFFAAMPIYNNSSVSLAYIDLIGTARKSRGACAWGCFRKISVASRLSPRARRRRSAPAAPSRRAGCNGKTTTTTTHQQQTNQKTQKQQQKNQTKRALSG